MHFNVLKHTSTVLVVFHKIVNSQLYWKTVIPINVLLQTTSSFIILMTSISIAKVVGIKTAWTAISKNDKYDVGWFYLNKKCDITISSGTCRYMCSRLIYNSFLYMGFIYCFIDFRRSSASDLCIVQTLCTLSTLCSLYYSDVLKEGKPFVLHQFIDQQSSMW